VCVPPPHTCANLMRQAERGANLRLEGFSDAQLSALTSRSPTCFPLELTAAFPLPPNPPEPHS